MFVAIVMFIFVAITAVVTAMISSWASNSKQKKIISSMAQDYSARAKKKEEVFQDANEKKEQVNATDTQSGFNASIDVLHQLSQKRK